MEFRRFDSSEGNVFKYVFSGNDFVAESVLYRYSSFAERTVICCSTQSGCPVGCSFCGTGKRFVRNLTSDEIVAQIEAVIKDQSIDVQEVHKFQIMFMSMGEPLLNWNAVAIALGRLNALYPTAQLLISRKIVFYSEMGRVRTQQSKKKRKLILSSQTHIFPFLPFMET